MINAKELARQLDRFLKSPTCQDARVVVKLPQGEFHSPDGEFDILSISLFENNIIGARESHRLVIELSTQQSWQMGSAKKKLQARLTLKNIWDQRQNSTNILRKTHPTFHTQEQKIQAVQVHQMYWHTIKIIIFSQYNLK